MVDEQRLTKIKRAILWIRKTLEITERTDVPESIENVVRPTLDILGWERLRETISVSLSAAAPAASVQTQAVIPQGILRYVVKCSCHHSDTGVTHEVWLTKRGDPKTVVEIGIPIDRQSIQTSEFASMIGSTFLVTDEVLFCRTRTALVANFLNLELEFIDIPIGEYIAPF